MPFAIAGRLAALERRKGGQNAPMTNADDILVIPVEGDLDVSCVARLRPYIDERVAGGCRRLILNMAQSNYVDSLGMSLIISEARNLREHGGLLSLVNVNASVYRSLVICRLVDFVPVTGTGPKPPIPALDPTVRPQWHGTMRVDPAELSRARGRVEQLLSQTGLTPDEVFDMTLAGGEALGNAIDHTCAEGVLLTVSVYADRVVVEVADCGDGFDAAEKGAGSGADAGAGAGVASVEAMPAAVPAGTSSLERGRGIKLMRMLADSVEIAPKPSGAGTVVRLVKLITPMAVERVAQG